jgi:hypothetical protein
MLLDRLLLGQNLGHRDQQGFIYLDFSDRNASLKKKIDDLQFFVNAFDRRPRIRQVAGVDANFGLWLTNFTCHRQSELIAWSHQQILD